MKKWLLLIIVFLLLLPSTVYAQDGKYAIIVGYDCKYCEVKTPASNCARLLQGILRKSGFSNQNIKLILNKQATRANLEEAFEWLDSVEDENSEVVIYFIGHGNLMGIGIHYDNLFHSEILELINELESEKQLIMLDHCGSGGAIIEGADLVSLSAPNRIVVTSTFGEHDHSLIEGRYTRWAWQFLYYGIKKGLADFNRDGKVSIEEASLYYDGDRISDGYIGDFFL